MIFLTDVEIGLALVTRDTYLRQRMLGRPSRFDASPPASFLMRLNPRFLAIAAVLIAAACSDTATSPSATAPVRIAAEGAPAFDFGTAGRAGVLGTDFTVTPKGGTFSLDGMYEVTFPAAAICDQSKSNYADWGAPCVTLKSPIKIHATVQLTLGGLGVDFQPELRFAPGSPVTISSGVFAPFIVANRNYFSQHPSALRVFAMLYTANLGSNPIPDYLTDPDAITHIDLQSGRVWRHVKHFSGYSIFSGDSCAPSADNPDCIQIDGRL